MTKNKWVWMPHAGHFICGSDCRFHLNTYVGGYIVSTLGDYWPDSQVRAIHAQVYGTRIEGIGDEWDANYLKKFGYHEIGVGRRYETMVFKARRSKQNCCSWEMESPSSVDFEGYNDAADAVAGHMKFCLQWSKK